jgi:hypothetical protein
MVDAVLEKYFVTFYSPGTFVNEETTEEVESWDVEVAQKRAEEIVERYNATPFGFRFTTRSRGPDELDSRETRRSPMYYLPHCKLFEREEIEALNNPDDKILISNMRNANIERVVRTTIGWRTTHPFNDGDILLERV